MRSDLHFDRALIVHDIWLDMILSGKKVWEMRSRKTNIRGRIGLIEAGSGLIKGDVDLIDCLNPLLLDDYSKHIDKHWIPKGLPGMREKYCFPWVLNNVNRYDEPIPYTHPKGAVIWVRFNRGKSNAGICC